MKSVVFLDVFNQVARLTFQQSADTFNILPRQPFPLSQLLEGRLAEQSFGSNSVRIVAFLFQCVQNVYFIAEWHFLSLLSHYPNYTFWIARNLVQNITRNNTNYRAICQQICTNYRAILQTVMGTTQGKPRSIANATRSEWERTRKSSEVL